MIELYDWERVANSLNDALINASIYTGFDKNEFKYEVIKEPQRIGLFKKEPGVFRCWYEYEGMTADRFLKIADAKLYIDETQKRILVIRFGYHAYEVDYSDLSSYEIVVDSETETYTESTNNAKKGALLFGLTGAIVGASNNVMVSESVDFAEIIIRLRFKNKKSFEILTCNYSIETGTEEWRDAVDESKEVDKFLSSLL